MGPATLDPTTAATARNARATAPGVATGEVIPEVASGVVLRAAFAADATIGHRRLARGQPGGVHHAQGNHFRAESFTSEVAHVAIDAPPGTSGPAAARAPTGGMGHAAGCNPKPLAATPDVLAAVQVLVGTTGDSHHGRCGRGIGGTYVADHAWARQSALTVDVATSAFDPVSPGPAATRAPGGRAGHAARCGPDPASATPGVLAAAEVLVSATVHAHDRRRGGCGVGVRGLGHGNGATCPQHGRRAQAPNTLYDGVCSIPHLVFILLR